MKWLKIGGGALAALLLAVLVGFLWGRSGKSGLEEALARAELRLAATEARSQVMAARVSLYNVNFGDASRQLEDAKPLLRRAIERLQAGPEEELARRLATAADHITEAQRLAGRLDQGANPKAAEAEKELDAVIGALPLAPASPAAQ